MSKPEQSSMTRHKMHPRMLRELKTVQAMIRIYCRAHHHSNKKLCEQCHALSDYAERRLAHCPFQEDKTTCAKCTVHCYNSKMRAQIVEVMRFSGPRMIFHHPFLACAHLLDERRSTNAGTQSQLKNKKRS